MEREADDIHHQDAEHGDAADCVDNLYALLRLNGGEC